MADNLKGIPFSSDDEGKDIPTLVKQIVYDWAAFGLNVTKEHPTFSLDEVYVVWFAYTLGNWKALCSTSLPDGRYYEVTYDAVKNIAFLDTYVKTHNNEIYFKENE